MFLYVFFIFLIFELPDARWGRAPIPAQVAGLSALVSLDASENTLKACPPSLPASLVSLDLSDNQIDDVPASLLQPLVNLETLMLFKNALGQGGKKGLPEEISALSKLSELNVFNNKLIKLPKGLGECAGLTVLNAGGNKIKTLPKTDTWTKLVELKAHQNGLIMLPGLETLGALETFKLDMNRALSQLPAINTTSLTFWETSMCRLEALPDGLATAANLVTLNCGGNKLASLPALDLPALEIFNVSSNELTALPDDLAKCSKLRTLFFASNKVEKIPESFAGLLPSIQRFNCSGQKNAGGPVVLEMTATLEAIKDACEKHDGRFIV